MPLDAGLFMQYAALRNDQNKQLNANIASGIDNNLKNKSLQIEQEKAKTAGFDLDKLAAPALIKMQLDPKSMTPQDYAVLKAWDLSETRKLAPDASGNYRKVNASIFGGMPNSPSGAPQGFDLGAIANGVPGFAGGMADPSTLQPMPDSFIGGVNDTVGQAPAPAVPLDVSMLQPTGDPNMDAYRAKMFEQNQGMVGDALPPVAPKMSGFDTELVTPARQPITVPPELENNPNAKQKYLEAAATAEVDAGKALAVESAKLQAEKTAGKPKAEAALVGAAEKSKNIDETIDRALSKINAQTAGMGSAIKDIPLVGKGSQAKDLASLLDTISADSAFSELQTMRDNSKTGGALGSITERELALLQNAAAALNQDQSPPQLRENLLKYKQIRKAALERSYAAFEKENGYRPQGQETPQSQAKSWQEYFN